MRADRLVAILLLLQRRQSVTTADVAAELEVSERTARRDLEALGAAGLPVYSTQGRGGGWRLAGGGRTDLSGLSADEVRASFLVAGPRASVDSEVRSALRKLVRALPEPMRDAAEAASSAVIFDPLGWEQKRSARNDPPFLDEVQRAVIDAAQLHLTYVARNSAETKRTIHPLGIAAKGPTWYLVADTENGLRTFRVDRIVAAERTGNAVVRPPGFELAAAWGLVVDQVESFQAPVVVRCRANREAIQYVRFVFGQRLSIGEAGEDDRVDVEIRGGSVRALVAEIAGFGAWLEVLAPIELREALRDVARELRDVYGD